MSQYVKVILFFYVLLPFSAFAQTDFDSTQDASTSQNVETLVFIRHAEKPTTEIGQIDCQGLMRSIKLPRVLLSKFGQPNAIFAPNPAHKIIGLNGQFDYIRPLATIEPTAVRAGLPVNLSYGYLDVNGMAEELLNPAYASSTVFIAWEHGMLPYILRAIMLKNLKNPLSIPNWPASDFDGIYILKIVSGSGAKTQVSFSQDTQGLNGLGSACLD